MIIPSGVGGHGAFDKRTGAALGKGAAKSKRRLRRWKLVLFPTCCSNAASTGQADSLIAAHKWFNLAALKGRTDAIPLRREVAEMMSEIEIAMAQREARAWMTAR